MNHFISVLCGGLRRREMLRRMSVQRKEGGKANKEKAIALLPLLCASRSFPAALLSDTLYTDFPAAESFQEEIHMKLFILSLHYLFSFFIAINPGFSVETALFHTCGTEAGSDF